MLDRLFSFTQPQAVKNPGAQITATFHSTKVDLLAVGNGATSCLFVVNVGAVTDGTYTFSLEDSPDDSTYTAVAAPYVQIGATTAVATSATTAGTQLKLGYLGNTNGSSRYVKLVCTVTGSPSTGAYLSANALLGLADLLPLT
jgi:hypothetical protein